MAWHDPAPDELLADDDKALKPSATIRGGRNRVGSVASRAGLGGRDETITVLSEIKSEDLVGHLKIGSAPELIEFARRIRDSGTAIFEVDHKAGIPGRGGVLIEGAVGVMVNPLANQVWRGSSCDRGWAERKAQRASILRGDAQRDQKWRSVARLA